MDEKVKKYLKDEGSFLHSLSNDLTVIFGICSLMHSKFEVDEKLKMEVNRLQKMKNSVEKGIELLKKRKNEFKELE